MIKLSELVEGHKNNAIQEDHQCYQKFSNSEITIVELSDEHEFKTVGATIQDPNSLALFLQCGECSFIDFINLFP